MTTFSKKNKRTGQNKCSIVFEKHVSNVTNIYNKLKFPALFSVRNRWEISICLRNCTQGSCSYFDLPLKLYISKQFQISAKSGKADRCRRSASCHVLRLPLCEKDFDQYDKTCYTNNLGKINSRVISQTSK